MAGQVFSDKILNNNSILDVGKIQINVDASESNEAVRKSQAEAISGAAVQSALVDSAGNASSATAFTSQYTKDALATKQPNMSIDAASTAYLEIVDGSKIKLKDLGITSTYRDTTHTSLSAFIAAATFNGDGTITIDGNVLDRMTFIFLTTATLPQDRTFVYLGTNAGDATDFVAFGTNYNISEIRSMLSSSGIGILFDANTGAFSLDIGTTASELGGQTIPHGATFTTISPSSDIKDALLKLEALINAVDQSGADGTAALTTKLNSRDGVTGTNYGEFTGTTFADNQSGKQLFQAVETGLESATSDRAAIRSEASARATAVDAAIATEKARAEGAEATLQSGIDSEAVTRATADAGLQNNITNEAVTRSGADSTLQSNIDSEATTRAANDVTLQSNITAEATARTVADDALQDQINALADSNIELAGTVDASGVFTSVDGASDSRNGQSFVSIGMKAGEEVVFSAAVTLLGNDFKLNDKLMVKVATITAGAMVLTDFVYKKGDGSDLTRANLGSATVDLNGSDQLRITPDSVGRDELSAAVEADVDDKVSLTTDDQTITGKSLMIDQSDSELGASYGLYLKKEQTGNGALTGTARALLVENWVKSDGSGNPALPSYGHNTLATHYNGACTDLSVVIAGAYLEANAPAGASINAVGGYAVSTDTQLGVNVGLVAMAENAAVSNVSLLGYASTDGVSADRGIVGALTSQSLALYSATRVADPFPFNDIAVVADAKYAPAGSKAFYSYGDVKMEGGVVEVPSATTDTSAVNLGDIKDLCEIHAFDLSSGSKVINTSLDLTKTKPATFMHSVSGVTVGFEYDSAASTVTVTATGANVSSLTAVKMFIEQLPCDITNS